ncbi:hypothetical protein [Tsukamurella spumae]|uniref:Uncharacterized protein n=1 Tax=Tsukamurella spumae TaxID=44753 RepID=A0A846X1K4_9ACTN|nr:hypothetical protein [Tsukamurella spumae]NKY19467.1 hypothetical protein [Tsukamurella spumae]
MSTMTIEIGEQTHTIDLGEANGQGEFLTGDLAAGYGHIWFQLDGQPVGALCVTRVGGKIRATLGHVDEVTGEQWISTATVEARALDEAGAIG